MNFDDYASLVRNQTKTDSTSFPNAELTLLSNVSKNDLAEEIVQLEEDYFSLTLLSDLVAGQREYSFPVDMLKNMKIVEINLLTQADIDWNVANPGSTQREKWKRLREFDLNSYRQTQSNNTKPYTNTDINSSFSDATTNEENIIDHFSDLTPSFDIDGEALFIYNGSAILALSGGLRLRATIYPKAYDDADWVTTGEISTRSASTTTAMPRASHEVMARRTIILFKQSNQIILNPFDLDYKHELDKMKKKLQGPNMDRVTTPNVPRDTGFNY